MLISIVVPTYNRLARVLALVRTFLSNSDDCFELIVVDDGSSDQTYETLCEIKDARLRVFRIANGERGKARNFGAMQAKAKYINYFDSDDLPYSSHHEDAKKYIQTNGCPEWLVFGYDIQDSSGRISRPKLPIAKTSFISILSTGNPFPPNSIFIRRDVVLANLFNESRNLSGSEDYELWLRLSMQYEPIYCPQISICFLCQWSGRSVNNVAPPKAIRQRQALVQAIDAMHWPVKFINYKQSVCAGIEMYFALLLSPYMETKLLSLQMLIYSLLLTPSLFRTKRPYAVAKQLILFYR